MLGSGFIGRVPHHGLRYVPTPRVAANWGAGCGAPRRPSRSATGSRALDSIDAVCADPEVDLVIVSLPNHLHVEAVEVGCALTARASPARSPSGGTARRRPRCSGSVDQAGVCHAYLENVVYGVEMVRMREMIEAGAIGRPSTFRAREGHSGPHAAALLGRRAGRRRGPARHGVARHRGRALPVRQGARRPRGVFAWGDTLVHARPDDRRGQRGHDRPLRGRPRRDDGRVVVLARAASRAGSRSYGDGRPDRPGHHVDAAPGVHRAARRIPRREGGRRHGLGLPGARRDLRPRPRRDAAGRRRGVPDRASSRARRSTTA